jgi:hypothetical protein
MFAPVELVFAVLEGVGGGMLRCRGFHIFSKICL